MSQDAWTEHVGGSTVNGAVIRSQSGRVLRDTLTDMAASTDTSTLLINTDAAGTVWSYPSLHGIEAVVLLVE